VSQSFTQLDASRPQAVVVVPISLACAFAVNARGTPGTAPPRTRWLAVVNQRCIVRPSAVGRTAMLVNPVSDVACGSAWREDLAHAQFLQHWDVFVRDDPTAEDGDVCSVAPA
jgi:hypothetical protein